MCQHSRETVADARNSTWSLCELLQTILSDRTDTSKSQAFKANGIVWVAGQIAADVDGRLIEGSVELQAKQIFQNLNEVLKEAGTSLTNVVKVTVSQMALPANCLRKQC